MKKNRLLKAGLLTILHLGLGFGVFAQTADLLDVRFRTGGQALNVAAAGTLSSPLQVSIPSQNPITVFESSINQYVSRFDGSGSSSDGPVYKLSYKGNTDFINSIAGSFTLETFVKLNVDADKCAVSAQEGGGFGIEHKGTSAGNTQLWYNSSGSQVKVGNQSIYSAALGSNQFYYHLVYVVDRSSGSDATVTAYYNGVANGSATASGAYKAPANADAHWIAIGGDAHPTYVSQYYWNGDVAYARMYSTALSATQVSNLYNQIQARKNLTKVGELNTILSVKLPAFINFTDDASKKTKAQALLQEGWGLMGDLTIVDNDIQVFINKIATEVGSLEPEVSTLPKVAIISDTHVGNDKGWSVKLNRAIDRLIAQSPQLDAVFINGDVTDWGTPTQLSTAKSLFSRLESAVPVYYLMGNHDWYNSLSQSGIDFSNILGQPLNQYIVIKGYPFITISMETSAYATAYQSTSQNFLSAKIAQAKIDCPGKPILVMAHMPVTGTVYGSYEIGGGDNWGTDGLKAICEANPEVVLFSGHSHYPLGDERSIHQDKFTSINEGSMTYSEIEKGLSDGIHPVGYLDVTEGVILTALNNGDLKVKRWDFTRDKEIKQAWIIKSPFTTASFTYKGRTGGAAPYFESGDKPNVSNIKDSSVKISFPQGKDDDLVHHYLVEVLDQNDVVLSSPKYNIFSGFFLNEDQPNSLQWDITGLSEQTTYRIRVTGIDSYGNVSVPPIVSDLFTTSAYMVDPSAVLPTADLLDIRFKTNAMAHDISAKAFSIGQGNTAPNTLYESSINQFVNRSTGNSSQYFKVDYKNDAAFKSQLQAAFSLESYVKFGSSATLAPVSSQETGGFGFEQANGGNTEFWFRKSSSAYDRVSFGKLNIGEFYHLVATWDNSTKKLSAYKNGVLIQEKTLSASDALVFSSKAGAQWIGIGGDAVDGPNAQSAFNGDVATARLYSKALSRDEIILSGQQIANRVALTKVDDLHTAITSTIPNASHLTSSQQTAFLNQAWALMNDLSTTDTQIITFLNSINQTLPVSLNSFSARTENQAVVLRWSTLSEQNNSHFELYRSNNGQNFQKIAEIKGQGESQSLQKYQFTDSQAPTGKSYYQLKQIDKNGQVHEFEKIVSATRFGKNLSLVVAKQANGNLVAEVNSPNLNRGKITIRSVVGDELASVEVLLTEGQNRYYLPAKVYKGLLLVTLSIGNYKLTQKLIN